MKKILLITALIAVHTSKAQMTGADSTVMKSFPVSHNAHLLLKDATNNWYDTTPSSANLFSTITDSDSKIQEQWTFYGDTQKYSIWNYKPVPSTGYYCDTAFWPQLFNKSLVHFAVFSNASIMVEAEFILDNDYYYSLTVDSLLINKLK